MISWLLMLLATAMLTSYFLFLLGEQRGDSSKDAYNFYLSQVRIRIEMAFGLLCGKWRILQKPLQVRLKNAGKVFICCARLHNFAINERLRKNEQTAGNCNHATTNTNNSSCDPDADDVDNNDDCSFLPSDLTVSPIAGNSIMRDVMVQRITDLCLVRPEYNRQRNKNPFTR
jgi:hypothetical protein